MYFPNEMWLKPYSRKPREKGKVETWRGSPTRVEPAINGGLFLIVLGLRRWCLTENQKCILFWNSNQRNKNELHSKVSWSIHLTLKLSYVDTPSSGPRSIMAVSKLFEKYALCQPFRSLTMIWHLQSPSKPQRIQKHHNTQPKPILNKENLESIPILPSNLNIYLRKYQDFEKVPLGLSTKRSDIEDVLGGWEKRWTAACQKKNWGLT